MKVTLSFAGKSNFWRLLLPMIGKSNLVLPFIGKSNLLLPMFTCTDRRQQYVPFPDCDFSETVNYLCRFNGKSNLLEPKFGTAGQLAVGRHFCWLFFRLAFFTKQPVPKGHHCFFFFPILLSHWFAYSCTAKTHSTRCRDVSGGLANSRIRAKEALSADSVAVFQRNVWMRSGCCPKSLV